MCAALFSANTRNKKYSHSDVLRLCVFFFSLLNLLESFLICFCLFRSEQCGEQTDEAEEKLQLVNRRAAESERENNSETNTHRSLPSGEAEEYVWAVSVRHLSQHCQEFRRMPGLKRNEMSE